MFSGGGQNLERRNVEGSIFRNSKIANIKITKDELNDNFIFEFFFFHFKKIISTLKIFDNFSNCKIFIFRMVKLIFFNIPNW